MQLHGGIFIMFASYQIVTIPTILHQNLFVAILKQLFISKKIYSRIYFICEIVMQCMMFGCKLRSGKSYFKCSFRITKALNLYTFSSYIIHNGIQCVYKMPHTRRQIYLDNLDEENTELILRLETCKQTQNITFDQLDLQARFCMRCEKFSNIFHQHIG